MTLTNFYKGTTKGFSITISLNDVVKDISSDTVTFTLSKVPDGTAILTKTADVTTSGASGIAIFELTSTNTNITPGTYFYKIVWVSTTNGTHIIETDTVKVLKVETKLLCTVDDVKSKIDTVGRWSDEEISDTISDIDDMIYMECGTPLCASEADIGQVDNTVQTIYYVGEENVFRVDNVFYGTTTKTELTANTQFKVNPSFGLVKILPVASSGITPNIECNIEIRYVPKLFHKLSLFRTCKTLLEQVDMTSGGKTSKELEVINARLEEIERLLNHRYGLQMSSDVSYYDKTYGVNKKRITQDFFRNNLLGTNALYWD